MQDTGEHGYDGLNGTRKMVGHMQNTSYTIDEYLICIGLGPSISSVICKNLSYSGPSYPSSPAVLSLWTQQQGQVFGFEDTQSGQACCFHENNASMETRASTGI